MSTLDPTAILDRLKWRYATKQYDTTQKIPADVWYALEQSLVLSPSSFGLQPWKFFVVDDPAVRAELRKVGWGQSQFTDASHLVVIASKLNFSADDVEKYFARVLEVTGAPASAFEGYKNIMLGFIKTPPPGVNIEEWVRKQGYIALGVFLTTAAVLGVDATPIEGFDHEGVNKVLGLSEQGYSATVIVAAGYRSSTDKYANSSKIRYATETVVKHV